MTEQTADNPSAVNVETTQSDHVETDAGSDAAATGNEQLKSTSQSAETIDRTKAFSQRLKEMSERKAEEARESVRKQYESHEKLLEVLRENGYEGDAKQIAETLSSQRSIEQDNVREDRMPLNDDHPALNWAKEIIDERTFESDLSAIKQIYPEVAHTSVWQLGDIYIRLMLTGEVDAVTAYEAQMAHDNRNRYVAPPSVGSAGAGGLKPDKEFYTPEEVDRLNRDDYEDPKIMARVRRSMTKWR